MMHVIIAVVIAISIPSVLYTSGFDFDFYSLFIRYLSLPVALMAFVWYVLIVKTPNKQVSLISGLSRLSFGVYFIHIFIMRCFLWKIDLIKDMPGLIQIPVITLSTLFVSFLIVTLISRLPFSKFIIGV